MLIDFLISKDGVRVEQVEVSVSGLRLGRSGSGLVPRAVDELRGTLRVTLADLSAAISRPEIVDQLLGGVPGLARPEFRLVNGDDGGIRIVGSVETFGRRVPVTTSTRIRVAKSRLVISPVQLQGLPLVGALPIPDLELPIGLPYGLAFTDVTTEPGCLVLAFEGTELSFGP